MVIQVSHQIVLHHRVDNKLSIGLDEEMMVVEGGGEETTEGNQNVDVGGKAATERNQVMQSCKSSNSIAISSCMPYCNSIFNFFLFISVQRKALRFGFKLKNFFQWTVSFI